MRTIYNSSARTAIKAKLASEFGLKSTTGLRITLRNDGLANDRFTVLGPQGKLGMRFRANGVVTQAPGTQKAKVTAIHLSDM